MADIKRAIMMTVWRRAPGVLRVSRPAYTREIEAFYEQGFEGSPGEDWTFSNPVLTLFCPDGYWRSIESTTIERAFLPGRSFFKRFPRVSSGQVLGDSEINNVGDVDAWPTWTIHGPMTLLTANNYTTGQAFTLNYPLGLGEQITITTLRPSVRGPGDVNLADNLNWPDAYLWGLVPGVNQVSFSVSGGGHGSAVQLRWSSRFEGA
jgi:hypothetical protein